MQIHEVKIDQATLELMLECAQFAQSTFSHTQSNSRDEATHRKALLINGLVNQLSDTVRRSRMILEDSQG